MVSLFDPRRLSIKFAFIVCLAYTAIFSSSSFLAAEEIEKNAKLNLNKNDRIVFIGNTFADQLRLYGYLETLLTSRHPEHDLTFRIMGWPGDTLSLQPRPLNFGSLDEHLARQKADVIVACFGMGESFAGPTELEAFEKNWNSFIAHLKTQRYNGKSAPRLVMVSPIAHESLQGDPAGFAEHNKSLKLYTKRMQAIAEHEKLPFVDLYHSTRKLMETNPSQRLTHNGIHLNQYGYWAVSQITAEALLPEFEIWEIELNVARGTATSSTAKVDQIVSSGNDIRFRVTSRHLPLSTAPPNSVIHARFTRNLPKLIIKDLKPGRYSLEIDKAAIITASHREWAAGVTITNTPSHKKTEQLRSALNDKNAHFFYRWRAHNSEYIVGRRTKPYGSVSFPPEMKKFDRLILEKDRKLQHLAQPLAGEIWELISVDSSD